jgi:hypothetical protein
MKIDLRAISLHLASMAWVAVKSFFDTVFILTLAGVILAGASYYFLRDEYWAYGVIAAVVAVVEAVTTGVIFGGKRALVLAIAHGLRELRIGQALTRLVFERMLGVTQGETMGERGGRVTQGLERLPLARAEEMLTSAIRSITGDANQGGWLRRRIQALLLQGVRKYTLARFREEDAQYGGVDLLKVKEELEQSVDDVLILKVTAGLRLWTALVIIGLPLVVAAQTYVIIALLRA